MPIKPFMKMIFSELHLFLVQIQSKPCASPKIRTLGNKYQPNRRPEMVCCFNCNKLSLIVTLQLIIAQEW